MKIRRKSDGAIIDVTQKAYAVIYSKDKNFEKVNEDSKTEPEKQATEADSVEKPAGRSKKKAQADSGVKEEGAANGYDDSAKSEDSTTP